MSIKLQEARNVGEWLEARLHLMFTEITDSMFGEGRLTRDERIALSSAIGAALDSFRATTEEKAAQLYKRDPYRDPAEGERMIESGFLPLVEKAVRRDGTIPIKLIQPGWGSSGYYPAEVLERDGSKVFRAGTKMFWNHPTAEDEMERPEGDLNDLAAELITDAKYNANGIDGAGLYADAKVFEAYKAAVDDLAPHIGVSIRAAGQATSGTMEGRTGNIIQSISFARSVDFVTQPGAGGKIIQMFEAARKPHVTTVTRAISAVQGDQGMEIQQQLKEAQDALAQAQRELTEARQASQRLQEALIVKEAGELVASKLAASTLPQVAHARLKESLVSKATVKDGKLDVAALETAISEAIKSEADYIASIAGSGAIMGMGGSHGNQQQQGGDANKRLSEALQSLGLGEKTAAGVSNSRLL